MCVYPDVLGEGPILQLQAATLAAILLSIAFWIWAYRRNDVRLRPLAVPIALWFVFGTLDILITAKGTFTNPYRESNPLTRIILLGSGGWGTIVASVLWIALWAGLVLALNKVWKGRTALFASLAVFYSLTLGHLLGFSSWYLPMCPIASAASGLSALPLRVGAIILAGCVISAAHLAAARFSGRGDPRAAKDAAHVERID